MPRIRNPVRDVVRDVVYDPLVGPYGAFSPLDISGLELWIDADLSPITLNVSDVAQIDDISGNARNFTASGLAQPLYEPTGWSNGTAQMDFNAFGNQLTGDFGGSQVGNTTGDGFTVFILCNPDNASSGSHEYLLSTISDQLNFLWNLASSNETALVVGSVLNFTSATQVAIEQLLTFNLVDGRPSNEDAILYKDGVEETTKPDITVSTGFQGLTGIGGRIALTDRQFPGKIKAVLVYSRAFDPGGTEQTQVENYLLARAGL